MSRFTACMGTVRAANLPTVVTNVAAAWLLASGLEVEVGKALGWLVFGAVLVYAGGSMLNDVVDVGFDIRNRPERAIPSGMLPLPMACCGAVGMLGGGAVLCVAGGGASAGWMLALVAVIVTYNIVHKRWKGAVLLMAGCRVMLWCVAASSVGINFTVVIWAVLSGVFIVAISWIARVESDPDAGAPLLPMVLLLLVPVAGMFFPELRGYSVIFGVLFVVSVGWAIRIFRREDSVRVRYGVEWLLATIPLLDAMAVAPVSAGWAVGIACMCVVCHCLQQWFAAS